MGMSPLSSSKKIDSTRPSAGIFLPAFYSFQTQVSLLRHAGEVQSSEIRGRSRRAEFDPLQTFADGHYQAYLIDQYEVRITR